MEEKYWELREAVDRAWDAYCADGSISNLHKYQEALGAYESFCTDVLEKLMDENSDVLRNLKEC